jgi:hypothetical protein
MRTILWCVPLSVLGLFGCSSAQPPAAPAPPVAPPFNTVTDLKQLMSWVIDPSTDVVWAAVGTIVTTEGRQEIAPRTDDEWTAVRNSAAIVAESGNLLMLPGRARNQDDWMVKARGLIDAASEAVKAAEAKDTEALFTAGGDIYQACTDCHAKYLIGSAEATPAPAP